MSLAWLIGRRYVQTRKQKGWAVSIFSIISVIGVALGVAVLIVVLSVMNGVTSEVRDKMLSMTAHAKILFYQDAIDKDFDVMSLVEGVAEADSIVAAAPFAEGEAVIGLNENFFGVRIKGIDKDKEVQVTDALRPHQDELARLEPGKFQVIVGEGLANRLRLSLGDKVTVIIPKVQVGMTGLLPRVKRMTVVGIFRSGHYTYDSGMMFTDISDAEVLFQKPGIDGFQLKLNDLWKAEGLSEALNDHLEGNIFATNWTEENKAYFEAVKLEKGMMFIILLIILLVATFNIVSTLIMVVKDKTSDIAILRTLGISKRTVSKIFIIQGLMLGTIGTICGVLLGLFISINIPNLVGFLEKNFNLYLPQQLYFISTLEAKVEVSLIVLICICSIVLSFLATIAPAIKAASIHPARVLAYE